MNDIQADPIERLIHELSRLPGIGAKTAARLAFAIVRSETLAGDLAEALVGVRDGVDRCATCGNPSAANPCAICSDLKRDPALICVVERPQDLLAIERSGTYRGHFHVLGGALSPLDGVGPEELRVKELLARIQDSTTEIILATNPTVEGDATALYLARLVKPLGLLVSRIARGVSVGAELEYTDSSTISRALEERREV